MGLIMPEPHQYPMAENNGRPLAVADLDDAAKLLKLPPSRVRELATMIRPYLHVNGVTEYWSLAQLERARSGYVWQDTPPPEPEPPPPPRPRPKDKAGRFLPKLSREDAEAAAILFETATLKEVARAAGCATATLYTAWKFYGIQWPEKPRMKKAAA